MPDGGEPSYWELFGGAKMVAGSSSSHHPNFIGTADGTLYHHATELSKPWLWKNSHFNPFTNYTASSSVFYPFDPLHAPPEQVFANNWAHNSTSDGNNGTAVDSTVMTISDEARDEILTKFQNFKQFDTIEDTSDHHFIKVNSSMKQVTFFFFFSKNKNNAFCFSFNLRNLGLPSIYFLNSSQRIGLKESKKSGRYWRRIYQVSLFVLYPCNKLTVIFSLSYHFCS